MKKALKVLAAAVIVLLSLALAFGGGYLFGLFIGRPDGEVVDSGRADLKLPTETEMRVITADEVESRLVRIGQFSTYSGEYTVTRSAEYSRHVLDDLSIPFTTNTINLECSGIVKVGYDVDDISVTVDSSSRTIYIALPEAAVNDNYVIWDTVRCDEVNNILNPIDFAQYEQLLAEIEAEGLAQAESRGIYAKAESSFKAIIRDFLSGIEGYSVVFL